ncbi:guanylate kinase [Pyrenophora seminiperda CCB06]|uniref:Guanylate kinase n=1 Tax=Pyrenophora seminiperda CCB06 TaxID=1302712 RepID=A0A3M7LVM2_9PLEO|nr:guanylate kinase [Pyrenophora seminiperda CCB06]
MPLTLSRLSTSLLRVETTSRLQFRLNYTIINNTPKPRLHTTTRTFTTTTTTTTTTMPPTTTDPVSVSTEALAAHRPIVISGPSGAGKSTILSRLFAEYPHKFGFSISHTTRQPRGTEQHGKEYYFVTKEEFEKLIANKGFVEYAQFGSNYYGTSVKAVNDIAERGQVCILDIEMEGVKQVANHPTFPRPRFLFLQPPDMHILEKRLRSRATDEEDAILKRLNQAKVEMEFAHSGQAPHDKIVINDDLDKAYKEVKEFIVGTEEA